MTTRVALAAMLLTALVCAHPGRAAVPPECAAEDDPAAGSPLSHVTAVLKPGAQLNVLAVGSAGLFGPELSLKPGSLISQANSGARPTVPAPEEMKQPASEAAFPLQMARALEKAVPGLHVSVIVRGGRGLTAAAQAQILADAIKSGEFQLVLWQTGTVEAVRNYPPAEFAATLADGAGLVEQAGADLILVDPQFSRFLQTNSNIEPYEQAMQQVGSMSGVMLFRRFELMRSWVAAGRFDLERTPKAERRQAVEQLHVCLGQQLANAVLQGAHAH